jgi:hypothetical protein
LVFIIETEYVLCQVRAEAEERDQHPALSMVLRTIDCKSVARIGRNLRACVKMLGLLLECIHEFNREKAPDMLRTADIA